MVNGLEHLCLYLIVIAFVWAVVRWLLVPLVNRIVGIPAIFVYLIDAVFAVLAVFAIIKFVLSLAGTGGGI